jgi:hypothetical protein
MNRTLRAMFGHKTGKSATGCRKLHKDDLHSFLLFNRKKFGTKKREYDGRACSSVGRKSV